MIKPNLTDKVVNSAKQAGATGATTIPASGTGAREAKTFFGLTLKNNGVRSSFLTNSLVKGYKIRYHFSRI